MFKWNDMKYTLPHIIMLSICSADLFRYVWGASWKPPLVSEATPLILGIHNSSILLHKLPGKYLLTLQGS